MCASSGSREREPQEEGDGGEDQESQAGEGEGRAGEAGAPAEEEAADWHEQRYATSSAAKETETGREGGRQGGRALSWSCGVDTFKALKWRVDVLEWRESYLAALQQTDEAVFSLCLTWRRVHTDKHALQEGCCLSVCNTPAFCPFFLFAIKSALTCQERPDAVLRYLTQRQWQRTLWVLHGWEWDLCSVSVTSTECSAALGTWGCWWPARAPLVMLVLHSWPTRLGTSSPPACSCQLVECVQGSRSYSCL